MHPASRLSSRRFTGFSLALATILAGGAAAGIALGSAAPAGAATRGPSAPLAASFSVAGELDGVAATSAGNAWAVGGTSSGQSLIAHWNGTSWKQASSSGLPAGELAAVAATSARNAWAVGGTSSGQSLILHWNGTSWKRVASAGAAGSLTAVAATSAGNAWAVGDTSGGRSLILHWNGASWKRVPGPSTAGAVYLSSVAATSGRNAWAVGYVPTSSYGPAGLILHWNGTAWKRVPTPTPTYGKYGYALFGVATTSAATAWAVGCTDGCPLGGTPLIERWNGTSWKQAAAPTTPYSLYNLRAVAASSAGNVWTVGGGGPVTAEAAATAHWNGRAWTLGRGIRDAGLMGIATTSATSAWAVGGTTRGRTLILHWNGKTWS
jgi:hypothetical protein